MKLISYFLIGIITYLIQAQLFPELFRNGWQPDLFLVWIVLITLIKGRKVGMSAAIVGGLLRDVLLGNFFGLHLFPYMAVSYIISLLGKEIYEEQWYRSVLMVLIATLLDALVRYGMLFFVFSHIHLLQYIWNFTIPSFFVNAVLAIIVHKIIWHLTEKEEYFW